jgi:hypothetical protein
MRKPSEVAAIVATIDPDAYSASSYTSDYVDMEYWHSLLAVVYAGTLASSASVTAKLMQATSSTGAGAVTIAGKAITALTTGDNDKQAIINLQADELNVAGGFKFVALKITAATAGGDLGGAIYGFFPRYGPANANDLASVDEIVA